MIDTTEDLWEKYQTATARKLLLKAALELAQTDLDRAEKDLAEAQRQAVKTWEAWSVSRGPR